MDPLTSPLDRARAALKLWSAERYAFGTAMIKVDDLRALIEFAEAWEWSPFDSQRFESAEAALFGEGE